MPEDPGLPIKFGPCSNGEFVPAPLTAVEREAIRRARGVECDANARAVGMSRREFLFTASAAATTLLVLQGCLGEAVAKTPRAGGTGVPNEAGKDADAARSALAGEEFIFDVQGHHLEYDLMRDGARRAVLRCRLSSGQLREGRPACLLRA